VAAFTPDIGEAALFDNRGTPGASPYADDNKFNARVARPCVVSARAHGQTALHEASGLATRRADCSNKKRILENETKPAKTFIS
jgi:hypothetical protein